MMFLRLISLMYLLSAALPVRAEGVTVFAAASLKSALDEIVHDHGITVSYAASSVLARQIALGAPADLVITANTAWMDYLDRADRVQPGTRHDLLSNQLVLVAPAGVMFIAQANRPVDDIVGSARLAMALVDAVPAGMYGKDALMSLGIWETLKPNVVQTDNVRAALRLVAMGEAPFGIVYRSDAVAEPDVQVLHSFSAKSHGPIRYAMAMVKGQDRTEVRHLWSRLQSPQAAEIFTRHGFIVLDGSP